MKTIQIKSEQQQLKEQYPELYSKIWQEGYDEGVAMANKYDTSEEEYSGFGGYYGGQPTQRNDNSERFHLIAEPDIIRAKMLELDKAGYRCGNSASVIEEFVKRYETIAWNPTHKLYAIDSLGTLHEIYSELVDSVEEPQ